MKHLELFEEYELFDKDLMVIARRLTDYLNSKGYNIGVFQAYSKGKRVLFKKFEEDTIVLTQYFSNEWSSGIGLTFILKDNKLKFKGYPAVKWRNDKYDTPENNEILREIVNEVENYNI